MSSTSTIPPRQGHGAALLQNGGVGAAVGVIVVVAIPYMSDVTLTSEVAAMLTGAIGTVAGYLLRFLPKPPN